MPTSKILLQHCFKNTSHKCFYPKFTSSLIFPISPASQDTRVHAQTSTLLLFSGCSMVVVEPTVTFPCARATPITEGNGKWAGSRWCRNWVCVICKWLGQGADTADCPDGHQTDHCSLQDTSPSLPWTCTSKKLTARSASRSIFCFVQGFVCFLFWLCFLPIKATFDMSVALKDVHLLVLTAPLSRPASVHPCSFLLCFTSSYLTTVSLFSKSLLALCHPFSL